MKMLIVGALILVIACFQATESTLFAESGDDLFQTISSRDEKGNELTELAFRPPARGVPNHVIDMYCANVKLRLYWGVYRETVKDTTRRTGQDVRRVSRLTRHYFPEVRAVDRPFDAPKLSRVDSFLTAEDNSGEEQEDNGGDSPANVEQSSPNTETAKSTTRRQLKKISKNIKRLKLQINRHADGDSNDDQDEDDEEIKQILDASSASFEVDEQKPAASATTKVKKTKLEKLGHYVKKYAPKVGIGLYTRWSTMWWLMMSCLFTKYYLWDPALDEFIKLKKTMIMYPDFLLLKLEDIDCLPTKFFQRIISTCKILNPLLKYSFGQLSLDKMMRFKGQPD